MVAAEPKTQSNGTVIKYLLAGIIGLTVWWLIYCRLAMAARYLTVDVFGLRLSTRLGSAVEFFLYDTPKVFMLLTLVVFGVGILRSFFTPERTRSILAGKREFVGNVLAALLGVATPFCSCSAVPLFIGFVTAGIPLGVTFSFLISAPMVNEVAVILLYGLLGWKVAAIYMSMGLVIAIAAGWILGHLHLEDQLQDWVKELRTSGPLNIEAKLSFQGRIEYALSAVKDIVEKVWLWMILGIAVGAGIHGYFPENILASFMGKGHWWSVPLAVLIGIPLYSNAAGIVPVVQALLEKGAALGTVLAFMMSVIAVSIPETVILRKVLKMRLIVTFLGIVICGILFVGYIFNMII
ncbi:MAG: permease [Deltaproteobacteria bacterium]|nr:permease [Deltaproteobacteria bacterium]MBF0524648.1 permease [Deltaproteobacteria bacterium]